MGDKRIPTGAKLVDLSGNYYEFKFDANGRLIVDVAAVVAGNVNIGNWPVTANAPPLAVRMSDGASFITMPTAADVQANTVALGLNTTAAGTTLANALAANTTAAGTTLANALAANTTATGTTLANALALNTTAVGTTLYNAIAGANQLIDRIIANTSAVTNLTTAITPSALTAAIQALTTVLTPVVVNSATDLTKWIHPVTGAQEATTRAGGLIDTTMQANPGIVTAAKVYHLPAGKTKHFVYIQFPGSMDTFTGTMRVEYVSALPTGNPGAWTLLDWKNVTAKVWDTFNLNSDGAFSGVKPCFETSGTAGYLFFFLATMTDANTSAGLITVESR